MVFSWIYENRIKEKNSNVNEIKNKESTNLKKLQLKIDILIQMVNDQFDHLY